MRGPNRLALLSNRSPSSFSLVPPPQAPVPKMLVENFTVDSPNVVYTEDAINSTYTYTSTEIVHEPAGGKSKWTVKPQETTYNFKVDRKVPKMG